jgi:hypothetical protein
MSRASQVVVLAEDRTHQAFVRAFLHRLGYRVHDIRFLPVPSGRGSGEQYVREHYAEEVKAFRDRDRRARTALIAIVDADLLTVDRRAGELRAALDEAHVDARGQSERVVHLIPRRHVETWVLCLTGSAVDETEDYKRTPGIDERVKGAGGAFFEWSRNNARLPGNCLPSMHAAIPEAQRLDR